MCAVNTKVKKILTFVEYHKKEVNNLDTLCIITELLKKNHKTQKDLTDFLGITKNSFTNWKAGHNTSYVKHLPQIADFFGVSTDYLLGRNLNKETGVEKAVKVYVYGKIPAGIPFDAIEDVIDVEEIPKDMTRGGKEYFALKISGNSMNPNYIDGDIVIFEKLCNCENNDDCAIMVNGDDTNFKRVEKK